MSHFSPLSAESKSLIAVARASLTDKQASFVEFALKRAHIARENAGYSGAHHDGGASAIEQAIATWIDGLVGQTPTRYPLDALHTQWMTESDPEYAKFLELKKRFEPNK